MATLLTMANTVEKRLGNKGLTTDAKTWVGRAHQIITLSEWFPQGRATVLINTADDDYDYNLPADFWSPLFVRNNALDKTMEQISVERWGTLSRSQDGSPEYYAIDDTQILVWRIPEGVEELEINYRKSFAVMTSDGDTTGLEDVWDQPIIELACWIGHSEENEFERANRCRSNYRWLIREIVGRPAAELIDRDEAVRVMG